MPQPAHEGDTAERLAGDIRTGRFSPGSWLKQIDLQQLYGVTRSEIRKALDHLASKRLVEYLPNRGYYVHGEDDVAAREIRDIRVMLETGAAGDMVKHARAEQIAELSRMASRFTELLDSATILQIYETNLLFHRLLLQTSGNASLVELVDELRLRTTPAPASQWSTRSRIARSAREHVEMVDALAERNAERLREVVRRHIVQDPGAGEPLV